MKAFQNYENSQFVNVSLKMLNDDNITHYLLCRKILIFQSAILNVPS